MLNQSIAGELQAIHPEWTIHRDRFYFIKALEDLGHDVAAPNIISQFGSISADMGVIREGHAPVLLEVRKSDDYSKIDRLGGARWDEGKLRRLAAIAHIDGYLEVFVCRDGADDIRKTIGKLETSLGHWFSVGEIHKSKDGEEWEWTFVCAKVPNALP